MPFVSEKHPHESLAQSPENWRIRHNPLARNGCGDPPVSILEAWWAHGCRWETFCPFLLIVV